MPRAYGRAKPVASGRSAPRPKRAFIVAMRLRDEVDRCFAAGAFEGTAGPLVAVGLELRDGGVLRRLEAGLNAERPSFVDQSPVLCAV